MRYLAVLVLGCSVAICAFGQDRWVSTCDKTPDLCKRKIIAMTAEEVAALKALSDAHEAKEKETQKAADAYNAVVEAVMKAHHADKLPAIFPHKLGTGGWIFGGTCMGGVEFTDGYIVYTPASDIYQCGAYKVQGTK